MSPQNILDFIIINLNNDTVESYKSKYGLPKSYDGQLLRLVKIDFPLELDVDEKSLEYNVTRFVVDDDVVEDTYKMREVVTDSDDGEEEELED